MDRVLSVNVFINGIEKMADNEFNGYVEKSEKFRFNEKGALTVPKQVRELAYHISIDIEILSIAKQAYFNYKTIPAYSFYGYVIIVLRDTSVIKIPIENSRQRLWTDIIHSAFSNWYALYLNFIESQLHKGNNAYLVAIGAVLLIIPEPLQLTCAVLPSFVETEIREIYVKTAFGTRFSIEVNWFEPVPVVYGDCQYDGKSGQLDDPEKDGGLPNESQPVVVRDSSDPYNGYPDPSSGEDKALPTGNWNNIKDLDGLDNENPDNEVVPPAPVQKEFTLSWQWNTYNLSCQVIQSAVAERIFVAMESSEIVIELGDFVVNTCGGDLYFMRIKIAGVAVDERAGGGNAAISLFNVQVVENE